MTGNTAQSWGTGAKAFHWIMAIMILLEAPIGYVMSHTYSPGSGSPRIKGLHDIFSMLHHTNGLLILALVLFRLGWRTTHPAPHLPAALAIYQRVLARVTQGLLYALMIALPLSGWVALSVLADSEQFGKTAIWFFGTDSFPRLPFITPLGPSDPAGYSTFGRLHVTLFYIGSGVLALHAIGAFWHYLVRRDGVLWAMWPSADAKP
jgi:cytochrome b561